MKESGLLAAATFALLLVAVQQAHGQGLLNSVRGVVSSAAARILSSYNENNGANGYRFGYETEDGQRREEKGEFVNGIWTVTGLSSYISPDGVQRTSRYKADDGGFQQTDEIRGGLSAGSLSSLAGVG